MTDTPTLDELMLAYDRTQLDGFDDGYQRLLRGGMITMQGVPTQEGERALVRAYRARTISLENRVADLIRAGNLATRRIAGLDDKRHWQQVAKGGAG